jgi:hypothetical protein
VGEQGQNEEGVGIKSSKNERAADSGSFIGILHLVHLSAR